MFGSEQRFRILRFTAPVVLTTSLEFQGSVPHVYGAGGDVAVSGNLRYAVSEEQVVRALLRSPGVTKVTTDLEDFAPEISWRTIVE